MTHNATTKTSADSIAAAAAKAEAAKQVGKQILQFTLSGFGAGLSGAKLYNLINSVNKAPAKYTKFGPGAKTIDDDEKVATVQNIVDSVLSVPSRAIQAVIPPEMNHASFEKALLGGGTMLGIYGGVKLMNALAEKRKKDELQDQVEDAKAQYQKALTGKKHAEALDSAFDRVKSANWLPKNITDTAAATYKAISDSIAKSTHDATRAALFSPFTLFQQAWPAGYDAYIASVLGSGALAGKMTYDWTRARSKDKAIENAQKVRARLSGTAPIYVDPDQLAAIKSVAS